jgi:DNA-binding NarL/FixJ family response regulator
MLDALMRRIDAATAALPGRPDAALRELRLARALLDAARQVKDTPAAGWDPRLTLREREVLGLLASGSRNKEIALRLGLRERTVKFHVANLLRKLDAQSRTEALRRALEFGLVESGGLSLAK